VGRGPRTTFLGIKKGTKMKKAEFPISSPPHRVRPLTPPWIRVWHICLYNH